ncbi:hypothetical protein BO70DRAFT_395735 [Aspergillus heteromorphus CBS 117.55]|uniref:Uncharacterized protein n=1 Tax=Aspergillus heteromorphus CBS 117.55 TaxID=1448321 RepID=A0A317WF50_9EURO|nr:uncharacterized protein BO70DRAFT_395735 [Aspergillus heteromorphus CBS 117.55]PWY85064.1 hypothetical protein BO70DRAFT_395735 [Aspergillus heteromorphus CBS 117.55]
MSRLCLCGDADGPMLVTATLRSWMDDTASNDYTYVPSTMLQPGAGLDRVRPLACAVALSGFGESGVWKLMSPQSFRGINSSVERPGGELLGVEIDSDSVNVKSILSEGLVPLTSETAFPSEH